MAFATVPSGNPVLGVLAPATAPGVPQTLRWLGFAVLAGFAVSVLGVVLRIVLAAGRANGALGGVASLVFAAVLTAGFLFWLTWTRAAWERRDANAPLHTLVIGILAVVFGALGVLGAAVVTPFGGGAFYDRSGVLLVLEVLALLVAVAQLILGVRLLQQRGPTVGA